MKHLQVLLLFSGFYNLKSSYYQALAQSDNFLSKLGVVRENVEDTAGAAQVTSYIVFLNVL